jgi:hypothetical protein
MRILSITTIKGYYGTGNPCAVLVAQTRQGEWYCVEGSININLTGEHLVDGVNVEAVIDCDTMQADAPVNDLDDLIRELEEI